VHKYQGSIDSDLAVFDAAEGEEADDGGEEPNDAGGEMDGVGAGEDKKECPLPRWSGRGLLECELMPCEPLPGEEERAEDEGCRAAREGRGG